MGGLEKFITEQTRQHSLKFSQRFSENADIEIDYKRLIEVLPCYLYVHAAEAESKDKEMQKHWSRMQYLTQYMVWSY